MAIQLARGFALGHAQYRLRTFHGAPMRVAHNLLDCVVFFGHGDSEGFQPRGTGFLLIHKTMLYVVTAKHVAEGLNEAPFHIRANKTDGKAGLFHVDLIAENNPLLRWFGHTDACVDLAVIPFPVDVEAAKVRAVALLSTAVVEKKIPMEDAGCGDMCHVIGLFSYRPGNARNVAVVHTGHIAALSDSQELISVDRAGSKMLVEGHLLEISNLGGLSGAPVFVRGGVELNVPLDDGGTRTVIALTPDLKLLGVWEGSWETAQIGATRVPVGMGIVTPAHRLIELLDSEPLTENRRLWRERDSAATAD